MPFGVQSTPYIFRPSRLTKGGPLPYNAVLRRYVCSGNLLSILYAEGDHVDT